jgi:hypothetical protein
MKTTQAWGWLLAGVLAAGMNAVYYDGRVQWAHQAIESAADRSASVFDGVLDRMSEGADQVMARAQTVSAHSETASCRLATVLARVQNKIAHSQAEADVISARQQAQMDRLDAARARMEAQVESQAAHFRLATVSFPSVRISPVVCPRIRVNVPRAPMVRIPAPVVHVELPGTGPV